MWTVDQDTHHTVTVEFYDREFHRDFHFTDPYLYDKACLSECELLRVKKRNGLRYQMSMGHYFPVPQPKKMLPWSSIGHMRRGRREPTGEPSCRPAKR